METINTYEQQANDFLIKTGATIQKKFLKFDYHFDSDTSKRNIFEITIERNGKNMVFNFGSSLNDSCKKTSKLYQAKNENIEIYGGLSYRDYTISMDARIKTNLTALKDIHEGKKDINSLFNIEFLQSRVDKAKEEVKTYNEDPKNKYNKLENTYSLKIEKLTEILTKSVNNKIKELLNETILEEQNDVIIEPTNYDILTCLTKYDPDTFEDFCSEFGYDEDSRKALKVYEAVKKEFTDLCTLFNDEELTELAEIQ